MASMQLEYRTHQRIAPQAWTGQILEGPGWTINRTATYTEAQYMGVERPEVKAEPEWKNPCALCPLPQNRALALYKPHREFFA